MCDNHGHFYSALWLPSHCYAMILRANAKPLPWQNTTCTVHAHKGRQEDWKTWHSPSIDAEDSSCLGRCAMLNDKYNCLRLKKKAIQYPEMPLTISSWSHTTSQWTSLFSKPSSHNLITNIQILQHTIFHSVTVTIQCQLIHPYTHDTNTF
jgi:hypothetical protein